jgi:hypothetical protein
MTHQGPASSSKKKVKYANGPHFSVGPNLHKKKAKLLLIVVQAMMIS